MTTVLVRDAVKRFLDNIVDDVSPATFKLYKLYLGKFAKKYGKLPLTQVTPALVRKWGLTYHPVQAVQRLMSWCKKEALLIKTNNLEGMKKMPRGRRLRTVARRERVVMMRAATKKFRRILIALDESIARPGELRRALWEELKSSGMFPLTRANLVNGRCFLFLDGFKAQNLMHDEFTIRVVPISKRLGRMIARQWVDEAPPAGHIFLNRNNRPWSVNAVRLAMRSLRRKAKLVADHRGENVVAYSMRHSGATSAIIAGVDLKSLADLMGHKDVRMTSRYVHLCPDHLAKTLGIIWEAKSGRYPKNDLPGSPRNRPDGSK